jgi:hypothetical protein
MRFYYADPSGSPLGPVDLPTLRRLLAGGQLTNSTRVAAEGTSDWTDLGALLALPAETLARMSQSPPTARPTYPTVGCVTAVLGFVAGLLLLGAFAGIWLAIYAFTQKEKAPGDDWISLYVLLGSVTGGVVGLVILVFCDLARATVNTARNTAELVDLLRKPDRQ